MALRTFDFEGTNGATLTQTNMTLQGTGTAIHSTADAVVGGTGGRCTASDGLTRFARCTADTAADIMAWSPYVRTPQTTPPADLSLATLRNASGVAVRLVYTTAGVLALSGVSGGYRNLATGVPLNTMVRVEALFNRTAGSVTAKAYTGAGFTTQIGSTFTLGSGFDAGTAAFSASDVGAITAMTPGAIVGFDYLRMEDGRTTEFGPPPAASPPTAAIVVTPDVYPKTGDTVTVSSTGSAAGSGSLTAYAWSTTEIPPGASSVSFSAPTGASATFAPTAGGLYKIRLTVTQTDAQTDTEDVTIYVHEASNTDVKVYGQASATLWTNEGGAASVTAALNDASQATWAQSPEDPTNQPLALIMNPFGPGTIDLDVEGDWEVGAVTRTVNIYKEDGTTSVDTETWALTDAIATRTISVDTAPIPALSDRRALRVTILDD